MLLLWPKGTAAYPPRCRTRHTQRYTRSLPTPACKPSMPPCCIPAEQLQELWANPQLVGELAQHRRGATAQWEEGQ
eukprot:1867412-Prorocentrum_lima.AAC.1